MDISNLFALSSAEIKIKHPITGEVLMDEGKGKNKKPVTITIMGTHTREYKKLAREHQFNTIKRQKGNDIEKMSLKEMEVAVAATEVADIEFLSKVVLGLNVDMDGKKVENKPSSIIAMFTDERTSWILQQVMDAKADEKLFFKG